MRMWGSRFKSVLIALCVGGALLSYQNCSGPQGYRYKSTPGMLDEGGLRQNGGTTTDNPKPTLTIQVGNFENVENAPKILLCVSEIRFEDATNGVDDTRIEMQSVAGGGSRNFIELNPSGTFLEALEVPAGNYQRIRVRLRGDCGGVIASVTNAFGEIQVRDDVDMEFSGRIVVTNNLSRLVLNMDDMIQNLAEARTSREVQRALEEEGSCGESDD